MAETKQITVLPRSVAKKAVSKTPSAKYDSGQQIPNDDRLSQVDGQTVRTLRQTSRIIQALRLMARIDGTFSTAVFNLVQVANSGLRLKAYNSADHTYSPEGTKTAMAILEAMSTLHDYSVGYADKRPIDLVVESALREVVLTAGVAGELVMNKLRLPEKINLVPIEELKWKVKADGTKYPVQTASGGPDIELDIPNFWVMESHLEANSAYPKSMLEAALSTNFHYIEFIQDMRRVIRKAGHDRTVVKLSLEQVNAAAPEDVRRDPAKLKAHQEAVRDGVAQVLSDLEPEDALVIYDVASEVKSLDSKGEKADYTELMYALAGMLSTSLKTHPSILGLRLQGSQSLSNTESLIYLKVVEAIQLPVQWFLSRALTLAARLYGLDVYVRSDFNPINLRPRDELEAFTTMREDRILRRWSLGVYTDEEAAWELGIPALPPGFKSLSGTMFYEGTKTRAEEASPNSDPMGRALQSDQPNKAGGKSQ